jgi:hypothetical protein
MPGILQDLCRTKSPRQPTGLPNKSNVTIHDEAATREEKKYITRTAKVDIAYKYIRAIDDEILGAFNKTAQSSTTFEDSKKLSDLLLKFLVDIFIHKSTFSERIAKSAVRKFSSTMDRELVPYTTTKERRIAESTSKNQMFKDAKKHIRKKEYSEALTIYKNLYEKTGSFVAGYNMALLLEANGRFVDALAQLEELEEKIAENGTNSPPFVKTEMDELRLIIDELMVLEDYTNLRLIQ